MKKPLFLSLIVLLFYTPVFFAQSIPSPQIVKVQVRTRTEAEAPEPPETPKITLQTYENTLKHYVKWSEHQADKSFYKDLVFVKVVNKKEVKIKYTDLSLLEQSLFLIYQAQSLSNHLYRLDIAWKVELQKLVIKEAAAVKPTIKKKNKKTSVTEDMLKAPAKAKDVKKYLAKLLTLRKANAVRFEALLKYVFKEHNKEIPAADQKNYLQKVTAWHDKNKLIERSKK